MASARATRNRLVGFRVTQDEHDLLCRYAIAEERTVTGVLRRMLSETVAGFGAANRERRAERQEANR